MKIIKIEDNKKRYMSLLFLADEQEDMIDRYLEKGTMYVLEENGVYCGPDFRKRRHSYEASSLLDRSAQLRDHSRSGLSDGRQL